MRIFVLTIATSMAMLASANAQIADRRSFLHPLGFWSNDGFVAQKKVYPRTKGTVSVWYFFDFQQGPIPGGYVLHENNW